MNAEWEVTGKSPESRRAAVLLADAEPLVAALEVRDLGELLTELQHLTSSPPAGDPAQILRAMLRSQGVHPLVGRCILQALIPGLVGVARRLSWGSGGEWEGGGSFCVDLVTTAWEVISEWSGQDRAYAVLDVLSAIRCRMRRKIERYKKQRDQVLLGIDAESATSSPTGLGLTMLEELARAIDDLAGNGIDRVDAAILYSTRVLGMSISEISRLSGQSPRKLQHRRRRAEERLCA
ncbi:MAG: hypothetical protein ACYDEP_13745 [Acidimicrobiales bacterium]|jgi:hypothetical protein